MRRAGLYTFCKIIYLIYRTTPDGEVMHMSIIRYTSIIVHYRCSSVLGMRDYSSGKVWQRFNLRRDGQEALSKVKLIRTVYAYQVGRGETTNY